MGLTFNDRFELMIKTLGYNPNSFAVALEYNGNKKIQRLIGTDSKPSVDMLIDIKKKFININIEWLITGEGDMLQNAATFSVEDSNEYKELQKKYIQCLEEKDSLKKTESTTSATVRRKSKLKN